MRETRPVLMREIDRYRDTYLPAYESGHLLVAGGIADQPARYLDLINAMQTSENTMELKHTEITAANSAEPEE